MELELRRMHSAAKRAVLTICPDDRVAHLVLMSVCEVRASGPWLCTGHSPSERRFAKWQTSKDGGLRQPRNVGQSRSRRPAETPAFDAPAGPLPVFSVPLGLQGYDRGVQPSHF
jgi:hypothetical protein